MITDLKYISPGYNLPQLIDRDRVDLYSRNLTLFKHTIESINRIIQIYPRADGSKIQLEILFNFYKRLSTLWENLTFGEVPTITAGEEGTDERKTIDKLVNDDFFNTCGMNVIDMSRYGTGVFKVRHDTREPIIETINPSFWFPIVSADNINNVTAHVIAYTFSEDQTTLFGLVTNTKRYLKVEIHEKGRITNKIFNVNGETIGNEIEWSLVYPDIPQVQETGVDDFLIVPVHNIKTSDSPYGMDDYSDIVSIVTELENRLTQIDIILDKHSDPSIYGPDSALEYDEKLKQYKFKSGKYIPMENGDPTPGYLTWDGQLEAAFKQLDLLMQKLYIVSETSPACFGIQTDGVQSGTALKRSMQTALWKAARIKRRYDVAIKKVLKLAVALDKQFTDIPFEVDDLNIKIEWQDCVENDPKEQAEIEAIRTGNKPTSSIKSAIKRLDGVNDVQAQKEVSQILQEESSQQPVMFNSSMDNKPLDFNNK